MPRISSNASQVLRKMLARPQAVRRELSGVAVRFAPKLNAESKRILQAQVYSVPIPLKKSADKALPKNAKVRQKTTKGSAGQWQRTGALKRAETARASGMTIILSNNQEYAVARNNLGTPRGRRIVSPGVQSVQWQQDAIKALFPQLREARRQAVQRGLRA